LFFIFETGNQEKLILKSSNLTALELLILFNKYVSSRIQTVQEEPIIKKFGKKNKK
jgi:hypothetical protein